MDSPTPLQSYIADHRFVLAEVARAAGFRDPVAIDLSDFATPLIRRSRRGPILPLGGVLVRDWDPDSRKLGVGTRLGMRIYIVEGIRFVRVSFNFDHNLNEANVAFTAVDRSDYFRLYRVAFRSREDEGNNVETPILAQEFLDVLWKNTIGYLEPANLHRIKSYGGRAKRGLLLTGPPGNGKTSACRWLWQECKRRNWEWHLVTADAYAQARRSCRAEESVRELFVVEKHGIVFFDDMDQALRNRDTVKETDDQSVFLNALDGMEVREGVAFVFTTNCPLDLIDRAFKRPGRIDVVLNIGPPNGTLRRRLVARWHQDIRVALDLDRVVASTKGFSFADIEEVKNLLIRHFIDSGEWDWQNALEQFTSNRHDLGHRSAPGFRGLAGSTLTTSIC